MSSMSLRRRMSGCRKEKLADGPRRFFGAAAIDVVENDVLGRQLSTASGHLCTE